MRHVFLLFIVVAFSMSCSAGQKLPEPQPMPEGATFGGVWFSPQFEHMYLRQTGNEVRGIYAYKSGGTLEGEVNGNLMTFKWIDPGDKVNATRSVSGEGYLQMVREGDRVVLRGEWGYNDSRTGGGPWEAEWVREMDADDPRNLDELRGADAQ